jgi:hypothetical protein
MYHTAAFAYIKGRSTIDAVKHHQINASKWFGKYDLHNFFGSTTMEFVLQQFSMVFPYSEVLKYPAGREELTKALDLAFLDGVLPQGTPLSPLITNTMMIPFDFELSKVLREFGDNQFVYTRYADDFIISSKKDFNPKTVESMIVSVLKQFHAPFSLNEKKTRYGSSSGRNWNLGVMLNKDNKITIGSKRKRNFRAALFNYAIACKSGHPWPVSDIQVLLGQYSYYKMVEGDEIDYVVSGIGDKFSMDLVRKMKEDISQN